MPRTSSLRERPFYHPPNQWLAWTAVRDYAGSGEGVDWDWVSVADLLLLLLHVPDGKNRRCRV